MSNPRVVVEFISRGTNQVAQQTQNVQNSVQDAGDAAEDAGASMLLLYTAVTAVGAAIATVAGLALILANRTADMAEESKKLAKQLGITTDQWERQKKVLGSITNKEGKETFELLKSLRDQQVRAATEGGKSEKVFNALGIAFKNADGSLVPLEDLLFNTLETLRSLPGPVSQTVAATALFGDSLAQDVLTVLETTNEELKAMGDKAEEVGLLLGEDIVAQGKKFNERFNLVGETLLGLTNLIGQFLLVNINDLIDRFIEWYNDTERGKQAVGRFASGLITLGNVFGKLAIVVSYFGNLIVRVFDMAIDAVTGFGKAGKKADEAFSNSLKSGKNMIFAFMDAAGAFTDQIGASGFVIQDKFKDMVSDYQSYALKNFITLEEYAKKAEDLINSSAEKFSRNYGPVDGGISAPGFGGASDVSAAADLQSRFNAKDPKDGPDEAIKQVGVMNRLTDRLKKNTLALTSAWGDVGTNIADVATDSIVYLADGMTNAITGMITGTQTLAESFQQMAVSIVRSIVQMIVQWIVFALIVAPIMSMLTWGASIGTASAGSASMFGIVSSAASTGAAFGASQATTAKADGGLITGGQQLALVNERGEEFVFSAEAVQNLGVGFLENLHAQASGISSGIPSGASYPAPNVNVAPSPVNVAILDNESKMARYLASRGGQQQIISTMKRGRIRAGIPT